MQTLTGTVGDGGANARHDCALVQAMLVLAKRPVALDSRQPRYLDAIDGDCGGNTKLALRQFQDDQVFVAPDGRTSVPVAGAKYGLVARNDPTWLKLAASVRAGFADLRALAGSKTVYIAGTAEQRRAATSLAGLTFHAPFRATLIHLIMRVHDETGIVVSVCADGDRRDFQTQYDLLTSGRNVTHAGPGESNHNFGQAVDLGFTGLRWLRRDGSVVENEDSWMHQLDPNQQASGESLFFWDMLRDIGTKAGLFRGPAADRPHLQAWSDAGMDMADRLAGLLTSSGKMRWTGRAQRYQCDLGYGGRFFDVGTAAQIWNRQGTINEGVLAQARDQPAAAGRPRPAAAGGAVAARGRSVPAPPVTAQEIAAMKVALRDDFVAADANWQAWRPR